MASFLSPSLSVRAMPTGDRAKRRRLVRRQSRTSPRSGMASTSTTTASVRKVPLSTDKSAAEIMLGDICRKVERRQLGIIDNFTENESLPLKAHLERTRRICNRRARTPHTLPIPCVLPHDLRASIA